MYSNKIKYNSSFIWGAIFIYIISPILSIPLIIAGIRNRYYGSFLFFAILLATIAYIMIPCQDLYRHTINYYYWQGQHLSDIKFDDLMLNGIITYVEWFMVNYSIPFEYLRFTEIFITFLLLSRIFNYQIDYNYRNYTRSQLINRIFIFILFYDFFYTAEGVRFGLALSFYIFGIHKLINQNSPKKCILYLIIAGAIHLAFIFLGPTSIFLYSLNLKKKNALITVFVLFILVGVFISKFGYLLGQRADWYFSGKTEGVASYSGMTIWGLIGFWLPKLGAISYIYILYQYYNVYNKWTKMAMVWLIIAAITSNNPVLFYRMIWIFMAIGIYMILSIERYDLIPKSIIKYTIICGLLFASVNVTRYYKVIYNSPVLVKLFFPSPLLFSTHTHFDKSWINHHINTDGSLKNDK